MTGPIEIVPHKRSSLSRMPGRALLAQWSVAFVAGAIVMFGVLAAWNGALPIPLPTPTPTPTVTPYPVPADAWAHATHTAMPVALTPPGSVVAPGSSAQVEVALGNGHFALVNVVADAPTLAPDHDQSILRKAVPQLDGMNVYYLPVHVSKVSGDLAAGADLTALFDGITANRDVVQRLLLVDWRKCVGGVLPSEIDTDGFTSHICLAVASPQNGLVPVGVRFAQAGGPYDVSNKTEIIWLPPVN